MASKILICDDEPSIRKLVGYNLEREGYEVVAVASGEETLAEASNERFDLLILDIMLPDINGFEVCRRIQQNRHIPIIFLTAKDSEIDTIVGLELGADDYMTKPFSVRELLARVKAVLRRAGERPSVNDIMLGRLHVDFLARRVYVDEIPVQLTLIEYELLEFLVQKRGQALFRNRIMDEVWGTDFVGDTRLIDVHISHLRDKLGILSDEKGYIETVRGVGYRLRG